MHAAWLWLLLFAAACAVHADEQPAGWVQFVHGDVTIVGPNGNAREPVKDDPVHAGETIITGEVAALQLRMQDDAMIAIRPSSRITIDEYAFASGDDASRGVFSIIEGGLRAITGRLGNENPDQFRIETPVATIGIRGTDLEPHFIPEDRVTDDPPGAYVRVNSGRVFMENPAGTVELGANEMAYTPDRTTPPARLDEPPGIYQQSQAPVRDEDDEEETAEAGWGAGGEDNGDGEGYFSESDDHHSGRDGENQDVARSTDTEDGDDLTDPETQQLLMQSGSEGGGDNGDPGPGDPGHGDPGPGEPGHSDSEPLPEASGVAWSSGVDSSHPFAVFGSADIRTVDADTRIEADEADLVTRVSRTIPGSTGLIAETLETDADSIVQDDPLDSGTPGTVNVVEGDGDGRIYWGRWESGTHRLETLGDGPMLGSIEDLHYMYSTDITSQQRLDELAEQGATRGYHSYVGGTAPSWHAPGEGAVYGSVLGNDSGMNVDFATGLIDYWVTLGFDGGEWAASRDGATVIEFLSGKGAAFGDVSLTVDGGEPMRDGGQGTFRGQFVGPDAEGVLSTFEMKVGDHEARGSAAFTH